MSNKILIDLTDQTVSDHTRFRLVSPNSRFSSRLVRHFEVRCPIGWGGKPDERSGNKDLQIIVDLDVLPPPADPSSVHDGEVGDEEDGLSRVDLLDVLHEPGDPLDQLSVRQVSKLLFWREEGRVGWTDDILEVPPDIVRIDGFS